MSLVALAAQADDPQLTEDDLLGELPSISLVSGMPQPQQRAPASTTVVTREMIDAINAQTWVDVFRLVPGFQAYYINGNRYGISYHGFGRKFPNHLEVMVNGRSIYNPLFSSIEWGGLNIALDDVHAVEIVRGSSAPAQGSNAFLGSVNIITKQPMQDAGWHLRVTSGERNTREGYLSYGGNSQDLAYRLSLNYQHNDGFEINKSFDPVSHKKDGKEKYGLNFHTLYTPNLKNTIDLQLGITKNNLGQGDVDHPDEYTQLKINSQFQSIKWSHEFDDGNQFQLHGYHNLSKSEDKVKLGLLSDLASDFFGIPITPAMVPLIFMGIDPSLNIQDQILYGGTGKSEFERYDIELKHQLNLTDTLQANWGAGIRYDQVISEQTFNTDDKKSLTSQRLFGHMEWRPSTFWTFNAGVMIENNNLVDTISSGRLGANFHLTPNQTLRFVFAQGRRSPSLGEYKEYNVETIEQKIITSAIRRSDENINEERLKSSEIGYLGVFPSIGLTIDTRLFYESIKGGLDVYQDLASNVVNLPLLVPDEKFSVRDNIANWDIKGFEAQLKYEPSPQLLMAATYSYRDVKSRALTLKTPITIFRNLNDDAPRHTASLLANYKFSPHWSASINGYHMTDSDWRDGNTVDQFVRIDTALRYHFSISNSTGSIAIIGKNITKRYQEHGVANNFSPRYFIELKLDF